MSLGYRALTEQVIKEWCTYGPASADGTPPRITKLAKLDVIYWHRTHGRTCLDVTIHHGGPEAARGAKIDTILARKERGKHRTYPHGGASLVPFVIDTNGRWGWAAETWMKKMLGGSPSPGP